MCRVHDDTVVPQWSSRLVWTNLMKLAPAEGGNPGGSILETQRKDGWRLLRHELAELAPRRVLILAGRWWFEPFVRPLRLDVEWRDALVVGIANELDRRFVIAGHPRGKPRAILTEVVAAFG